jgi:sodium/proline symporter
MNIYFVSAFLLYFAILLLIGLMAYRKQTSSADFIMGNRSLSFWLVALSAHASDMSAWLFMGLPAAIFTLGLSQSWIAIGLVAGMFLNWKLVAPKLRMMTEKYDCYTLSSFFEKRFEDHSGTIRLISSVMFILFLTHYLSAGMIGIGNVLESLFNINYYWGLTIALLVVVSYTFIGGFVAVAWTDLFQGVFLFLVILVVPVLAFMKIQNFETITRVAEANQVNLSFISDGQPFTILLLLSLAMGWGVGYFGMPHVITKFMSIKNTAELNKSMWLGMSWQVIVLTAAVSVGLIGIAFFPQGLNDSQMVFVNMVKELFHPFIAGFILCGILAASLSTMDSQILVCASIFSEDLYPKFGKQEVSSNAKLLVSRLGVIGISLIALGLSLNRSTTIMDTVGYSWAGLGSSFGPIILTALYSKLANRYGAIAGILTGGVTVMIWPHLNPILTQYTIQPMIPGFLLSMTVIQVVSYLTQSKQAFDLEDKSENHPRVLKQCI